MEEDDEDRGFITAKDFMNDFATEDFISKNIRVRPHSGVQRGENDETKTKEDAHASRTGDGAGDDDDKFNEIIKLELENDREVAKDRLAEYRRRKMDEEERAKKKRH